MTIKPTHQRAAVAALGLLCLSGCTGYGYDGYEEVRDANIVAASHDAAAALVGRSPGGIGLSQSQPIVVTTLVSVDNLKSSSTFGRMASEQISSQFTNLGYTVVELKLRGDIFVQNQNGEFILSREIRELSMGYDAQAIVAGTYAAAADTVYVTTRLIRPTDSVVLSAYDYSLPVGPNTRALLRN